MSLSFRKWREMALTDYPVVSDKYYKKVVRKHSHRSADR